MAAEQQPAASLEEFARRLAPHLDIVSISHPEPVLRAHNVVAFTLDEDEARRAVVTIEADEENDANIGVVVMSADPDRPVSEHRVDPEHVTGVAARRSLAGGLVGAAIGAVVMGSIVAALTSGTGPILGAAIGGAIFFAMPGAVWLTFAALGGSDAYRQTFVPPEVADLALVSLHTDDPEYAATVRERLAEHENVEIVEIDAAGRQLH